MRWRSSSAVRCEVDDRAVLDRPDRGDVAAAEELQRLAAGRQRTAGAGVDRDDARRCDHQLAAVEHTAQWCPSPDRLRYPRYRSRSKTGAISSASDPAIRQLTARGPERGTAPAIRALPHLSATGVRSTFCRPILCRHSRPDRVGSAVCAASRPGLQPCHTSGVLRERPCTPRSQRRWRTRGSVGGTGRSCRRSIRSLSRDTDDQSSRATRRRRSPARRFADAARQPSRHPRVAWNIDRVVARVRRSDRLAPAGGSGQRAAAARS